MKEHAQQQDRPQATHSDLRPVDPSTDRPAPPRVIAAASPGAGPGVGSVLDHLRRGRLGAAWDLATTDDAIDLPGRADLERRFGSSLSAVRVHAGRPARSLLDYLGAEAATVGTTILLRGRSVDRATVAHEVAHALQSEGDAPPVAVVDHDDEAEDEAEALGVDRGPGRVRHRLRPGALALRRPRQRDPDAASSRPALGADELDRVLEPLRDDEEAVGDDVAAAEPVEDEPAAPEPEADDVELDVAAAEPADEEESAATDVDEPEIDAGPTADAERPPVEAEAGGGGPDRRRQMSEAIDGAQDRWDGGAEEVEEHEVEACPENANAPGSHPFARGPPLDVPAISDEPIPDNVERADVPTRELDQARQGVDRRLDRAPARAPPTDQSDLDADERAELRRAQRELEQTVDAAVREEGLRQLDDEQLEMTGDADPERITTKARTAGETAERHRTTAADATAEDFGDDVMAPDSDPTEDLDTGLDQLEVPEVDVDSMVDTSRLDLVAADANVGTVGIDEVVLVRDEDVLANERRDADHAASRRQIDADIGRSDTDVAAKCTRARASREQVEERVRVGVANMREGWGSAVDDHVRDKNGEADRLVESKRTHVETLQEDTDRDASAVIEDARTEADTRWEETQQRAQNKAEEPSDSSWFSRGIDWLRDALSDLVEWLDDFIDACHAAIDALLDAAAAVAHGIIEAGRSAITATIDALHTGLDIIVDSLPGQLGDIANDWRDDIHDFLDERQEDVDDWADDLHQGVDEAIEDLRTDLHGALDDFQEGVHDAADALDDILENGLMPWLRANFPFIASLIDTGLLQPIRQASELLEGWLDSALEATGVRSLQTTLESIDIESLCEPPTEEEQAEDCAAFEATLQGVLDTVDEMMASPVGQQIQAFLTEQRDEAAAQQVEATEGFFSFITAVARPVYEWWQEVEPAVQEVLDDLGEIASTIWRHIAEALGIDINLSPLEALRAGLEALWDTIAEAVAPIVDAVRSAWDWIRNQSFLAPLFDFFASLPELWNSLTQLLGQIVDDAGAWLASAAEALANTILPIAQSAADAIADLVNSVIDRVEQWVDALIGALDMLLGFAAINEFVEALATVVVALVTPIRVVLVLFKGCALRAWRWLANSLRDLGTFVRTLIDVAVGLSLAMLTFPIGLVAFLAGNVWLHLVPDCYKGALINFFLDLAIRFISFLPEPADFMFAILYQGALNFLIGLRAAADAQKIGAVNLFASIFAGNAEVAAGFLVGLAEGVWESTGGTIIFLLQAVAWIISLPFKLLAWAAGMVRGAFSDAGPGEVNAGGGGARAPPVLAGSGTGRALDARPSDGTTSARVVRRRRGESPDRDDRNDVDERNDEDDVDDVDVRQELDRDESDPIGAGVGVRRRRTASAELVRRAQRAPPSADRDGAVGGGRNQIDDDPSRSDLDEDDLVEDDLVEDDLVEDDRGGQGAGEGAGLEPPAAPDGLPSLGDSLRRLVTDGFSRQDVQQLIDGARASLRGMVGRLAQDAARSLLEALNARGAGFAIGRAMGSIVGQIIVELLLAAFTGGASTAITAAKAAITSARVTARLASVIAKIRRALRPLLGMVQRLRGALGDVIRGIRRWFDDVLGWMRGVTRRVRGRGRPRGGRPRAGRRGGRSRGGRRSDRRSRQDGDRRNRRRRDDDNDAAERRRRQERRLRRVMRVLRPRVQRMLRDGAGRRRLLAQLRIWRVRHRLSSLRLGPDGSIVARINPRSTIRLGKIRPGELGRILRPVLAAAQRRWVAEVRARGSAQLRSAERRAARGDRQVEAPGEQLSRGERQALMTPDRPLAQLAETERALAAGQAPRIVRPTPFTGNQRFRDGPSLRQDPFRTGTDDLATTFINMARLRVGDRVMGSANDAQLGEMLAELARDLGVSERSMSRILAAPRPRRSRTGRGASGTVDPHQDLVDAASEHLGGRRRRRFRGTIGRQLRRLSFRDDLEAARNAGIGPANALARQLGVSGDLSLAQQFGRESGYSPASREGVASTDANRRRDALAVAEGDIGRIFHRLERAMRRPEIFKSRTGFDARPLLAAVRRFLAAHRSGVTSRRSRRELARAADALVNRLVALLSLYD